MKTFFNVLLTLGLCFSLIPVSFAAVVNDECTTAELLASPVTPTIDCGGGNWLTSGTGINSIFDIDQNGSSSATKSTTTPLPTCTWAAGGQEDAWFKIQVPMDADGLDIEWTNEGGCSGFLCSTDLHVAAYDGGPMGDCSTLTYLGCEESDRFRIQAIADPGDWIFLRAWEEDDQGFEINFSQIRAFKNDCDDCAGALDMPFTEQFICGLANQNDVAVTYPLLRSNGARPTASGVSFLPSTCPGLANPQDIWLTVELPAGTGGVEIQFENLGNCVTPALLNICETDVSYAWYTTSTGDCSGLEFRGCDKVSCFIGCSDGVIKVDGRPGERVYVRIWEQDDQGFDIEVNQLTPTAPADKCYTALPLNGIGCNYEATAPKTGDYPEPDTWTAQAHTGTSYCDPPTNSQLWVTNENTVWYTFEHPAAGPLNINIRNITCTGAGITPTMQMGVFSNAGGPNNPTCDLSLETGYGCAVGTGTISLNIANLPAGDYILLVDGTGGNQCVWEFRGNNVLPVDMVYFKVWEESGAAHLQWLNSKEVNNSRFEVLRSSDGKHYEEIDFVEAMPTPNTADDHYEYQYLDTDIGFGGRFYYRLKQVDIDGSYTMSNVVEVNIPYLQTSAKLLPLYPNPANQQVTIPFFLSQREEVDIALFAIDGRATRHLSQRGWYDIGEHEVKLDLAGLPKGLYFLRFQTPSHLETRRLLVK